jgi:hypothetical protein
MKKIFQKGGFPTWFKDTPALDFTAFFSILKAK